MKKRTILTREKKNITNWFVYYTLKPEIEMWSKQQKNTLWWQHNARKKCEKHMHTYILWNQLWMCVTLDEW